MPLGEIFLLYVCPSLGGIMSTIMFAAPVNDMRAALVRGDLGNLNTYVFAAMTGNTLGWLIYGYFLRDPFLIASNLPGFILSIWLNCGAAKLQYLDLREKQRLSSTVVDRHQVMERWDTNRGTVIPTDMDAASRRINQQPEDLGLLSDNTTDFESGAGMLEMTPQETLLLRVLVLWAVILVYTSWLYPQGHDPAILVGAVVNINLIVFYGTPLKTISTVISERNSASIHFETMVMNWINTSFWIGYGLARKDLVIILPNGIGLLLGIAQGILCLLYPRHSGGEERLDNVEARLSLQELESDLLPQRNLEESIPAAGSSSSGPPSVASAGKKSQGSNDNNPEIV